MKNYFLMIFALVFMVSLTNSAWSAVGRVAGPCPDLCDCTPGQYEAVRAKYLTTMSDEKSFSRNAKQASTELVDQEGESVMTLDKEIALFPEVSAEDILEADAYVKKQKENLSDPSDNPTLGTTWYVSVAGLDTNDGLSPIQNWFSYNQGPFRTIQHAVNVASNGDVIQVLSYMGVPTEYHEKVVVANKNIELRGNPADPSKIIIDGDNLDGFVVSLLGITGNAKLNGFTIQHGRGYLTPSAPSPFVLGGGVAVFSSPQLILENLVIKDNVGVYGAGIYMDGSPGAIIRKSIVTNNHAEGVAGIYIVRHTFNTPSIASNLIENTVVSSNYMTLGGCSSPLAYQSAGIQITSANVDIVNSTVVNNENSYGKPGAGLVVIGGSSVNVVNSIFWGNYKNYAPANPYTVSPAQICVVGQDYIVGYGAASNLNAAYSDIQGGLSEVETAGTGNIINWLPGNLGTNYYGNPLFHPFIFPLMPNGMSMHYPLRAASPCLAAGVSQVQIPQVVFNNHTYPSRIITAPATDISGNQRPGFNNQGQIDPNPDMGAYETGRIGDVSHDGNVNAIDALLAARHFTGAILLNPSQQVEADANDSGNINSSDSLLILKYFADLIPALPYTGP